MVAGYDTARIVIKAWGPFYGLVGNILNRYDAYRIYEGSGSPRRSPVSRRFAALKAKYDPKRGVP
jgi:hypothetical protein